MTAHCPGYRCDEYGDNPTQPSTSSTWARRDALEKTEAAIRAAREKRKKPVES